MSTDTARKISFCLTSAELKMIDEARRRIAVLGPLCNRSEAIRAAIVALGVLPDSELVKAVNEVARLRPGRRAAD